MEGGREGERKGKEGGSLQVERKKNHERREKAVWEQDSDGKIAGR